MANKQGEENDYSVCTTWLIFQNKYYFLLDVLRGRFDFPTLRRKVYEQAGLHKPSRILIEDAGTRPTDLDRLDVGDLVFFDADTKDGPKLDHVGMYLGIDASGAHRFISSRKTVNGPTLGDAGGPSILDGTAKYARRFRGARRL